MRFLLINTAISNASVVLFENNQIVSITQENNANDLSAKIFYMIDKVFADGHCTPKDLHKIFVVNGPGSFTGIRIGMSIAKTMAWTLGIDLIPISSLELLASINSSVDRHVSLIDARRGCVYAGGYDSELNSFWDDQYIHIDELLKQLAGDSHIQFLSFDDIAGVNVLRPQIDYLKVFKKHEFDEVMNCHFVNPVYLKLTEAEEKRNHGDC